MGGRKEITRNPNLGLVRCIVTLLNVIQGQLHKLSKSNPLLGGSVNAVCNPLKKDRVKYIRMDQSVCPGSLGITDVGENDHAQKSILGIKQLQALDRLIPEQGQVVFASPEG